MTLETSRNISIIWLSLFCLVGLLPPVVILYFAVMGMNWVRRESKPIFQRARQGSDLVKSKVDDYSNVAINPLIVLKRRARGWQRTVTKLLGNSKSINSQGENL